MGMIIFVFDSSWFSIREHYFLTSFFSYFQVPCKILVAASFFFLLSFDSSVASCPRLP